MESSLFSGWSSGFGVLNTKYSSYTVQPLATLPFRIDNTDRYTETNSNRDLDILTTAPLYSIAMLGLKYWKLQKKHVWDIRLGGRTAGNYSIFHLFCTLRLAPLSSQSFILAGCLPIINVNAETFLFLSYFSFFIQMVKTPSQPSSQPKLNRK